MAAICSADWDRLPGSLGTNPVGEILTTMVGLNWMSSTHKKLTYSETFTDGKSRFSDVQKKLLQESSSMTSAL